MTSDITDYAVQDQSPSFSIVKKWPAEFKGGHTSVQDDGCSVHPKTAAADDVIKKIHTAVKEDRRISVLELANLAKISKECVGHILHEVLSMKMLSARGVPHLSESFAAFAVHKHLWAHLLLTGCLSKNPGTAL